jgi:nitrite reductase/ring-hydroxylating ferredoxin subunit
MTEQRTVPPYPGSQVAHVGTYQRQLPVNLERMYENALDWAHLPYVHSETFSAIECLASGAWGWRATLTAPDGAVSEIELRLDRSLKRWITRNLEGPAKGAEIWTHVFEEDAGGLSINVDFFVPGVPEAAREKVGAAYARVYARLYDEDVDMMVTRQNHLDQRVDGPRAETLDLGPASALPERSVHQLGSRQVLVLREGRQWHALPALCPHQLGPLAAGPVRDGCIVCPWHGYRFELAGGACRDQESLRLPPVAAIEIDAQDHVWLRAAGREVQN